MFSRNFTRVLGSRLDLSGSRDIIGQVTIWFTIGHFLMLVLWDQISISNGFWHIQWRMWRNGSRDLKRPLNKSQGRSFWYQSVSHNATSYYKLSIATFTTHHLATIHNVIDRRRWQTTTDRRTKHCSATVSSLRSAKNWTLVLVNIKNVKV